MEGEEAETVTAAHMANEQLMAESKKRRECPVPKPGGLVGQIMGFREQEREKPAEVLVKEWQGRKGAPGRQESGGNEP